MLFGWLKGLCEARQEWIESCVGYGEVETSADKYFANSDHELGAKKICGGGRKECDIREDF